MQEATGVAGLSGFTSRFADNSDGWQPGGLTGQKVNPVQIIIKEMGSGGASDPLNQRGSIGWKTTHVSTTLNVAFAVIANCASSYGSNS